MQSKRMVTSAFLGHFKVSKLFVEIAIFNNNNKKNDPVFKHLTVG